MSKQVSHWPVSLLDVGKIFVSVLVARLNTFRGEYIGEEQAGFLKQSYMRRSIRRTMNLTELAQIRKAFDRVEWYFLFEVLRRMGFGPGFLGWIRIFIANKQNIGMEGYVTTN